MSSTRMRSPIIELFSDKAFSSELQASRFFNISRYYIRNSLKDLKIVKNKLKEDCAFSPYYFGMDTKEVLKRYT
jgi:hypothetical protein